MRTLEPQPWAMNTDRIDFISAYCDRWCERCRFTSRCSSFAVEVATAMCGDFTEGLELALGAPCPAERDETRRHPASDFDDVEPPDEEVRGRRGPEVDADAQVDETSLMSEAHAVTAVAWRWLNSRAEQMSTNDTVLQEALSVAAHDAAFITAKLARAFHGRHQPALDGGDGVQTDSNGSAKVALISLERSETAWRIIAQSAGEDAPAAVADALRDMKARVERSFPDAWAFVRPGFDEPWR